VKTRDTSAIIVNVEKDQSLSEENRGFLRKIGVKTMVIIPLVVSGDVIGSLGLDIYSAERATTPEMIGVAQTVASQLAIGLQNVRLLTDAHRRAEQLQRVASFSQSVQATFDPADIFNTLLNISADMLPVSQMSIMLYDSVRQELRTVAQRVDNKNQIQLVDGELVPISGPIGQVWSTRETLHIPDLRKSSQPINPAVTVRSWIMTPILSRGRATGLVSIGSNRPFAYADTDVALFAQMISQLAAALENAEAYQQSQRVAKNEALVNDISTQLQRQMDIRSMLDITASELGKVLGARKARIRLATHVPDNGEAE
jgi:GAF domain-containing protein